MNERDSEAIGALLVRHGYALTDNEAAADVILVNTCSVRGKAEDKALGGVMTFTGGRAPSAPAPDAALLTMSTWVLPATSQWSPWSWLCCRMGKSGG